MLRKVLVVALVAMGIAAVHAGDVVLKLSTDKADAIYKKGDKIVFTVEALEDGKQVADVKIRYELMCDGKPTVRKNVVTTATPLTLESSLDKPGWTWIKVFLVDEEGKVIPKVDKAIGAMVDPLEIKQGYPEPADFVTFWKEQRKKLDEVPVKAALEVVELPANQKEKYECFDVKIDCAGGMPVSGYLTRPVGAKPGSLKAVVSYHGAGVRSANKAFRNAISLDVNAHGIINGQSKDFYDKLRDGDLKDYRLRGSNDRNQVYFLGMFLRVMRAMDYIKTLPEWDGENIIVTGGSQGGGQALVAAAMEPKVVLCLAGVPALCDHGGCMAERNSGWPRFVKMKDGKPEDPKVLAETAYFDGANFAKLIKCETFISTGFADSTCVPTSVYATFNNLPEGTKKTITTTPAGGHGSSPNKPGNDRMNALLK